MAHQWENKKLFRLGKSLSEAHHNWADRIGPTQNSGTIDQLLDRYSLEIVSKKATTTQMGNLQQIKTLRAAMGNWRLSDVKPQKIYEYVDKRSAKVNARREVALLSHAFTKAVQWGYVDRHPFLRQVRFEGEKARTRYVEDWELEECFNLAPRRGGGNDATKLIQAYLRLKMLLGLRQGDILRLKISDFTDEGIPVGTSKTGKRIVFSWTPSLRAAVEAAKILRPVDISPWLFCTRRGECYVKEHNGIASGFQSMWQRFMARVIAETKVTEKFTEHDIRAKVGSDAESDTRAQAILGHDNMATTKRAYRRRPEVVVPLR